MKIAIVDDEAKWRKLVLDVVKGYTEEADKIDIFESGVEFIKKRIFRKYYYNFDDTFGLCKKRISSGCIPVCG